ncbi:MAG: hypothetical protein K9M02_17545 [Thiohalocapsa sp.]|nr:hypothetical protein [Thiohalocapsa sp.]
MKTLPTTPRRITRKRIAHVVLHASVFIATFAATFAILPPVPDMPEIRAAAVAAEVRR